MTRLFWELYLPVLAILFGVGILTGVISGVVERAWRRWRCRREMQQHQSATATIGKLGPKPWPHGTLYGHRQTGPASSETMMSLSRDQLENLATARDKAERKIH